MQEEEEDEDERAVVGEDREAGPLVDAVLVELREEEAEEEDEEALPQVLRERVHPVDDPVRRAAQPRHDHDLAHAGCFSETMRPTTIGYMIVVISTNHRPWKRISESASQTLTALGKFIVAPINSAELSPESSR